MDKASDGLQLTSDGAAYIRVSDDQQDTLRQYEAIRAFEKRHGVTIPKHHWFEDEGWARDTADRRPDFQRLMKLAEAGQVRWIVVSERDRFGTKNSKQLISYLYRLEEAGCKLYDVTDKEWTGEDIATVITAVVDGEKSKGEQHGISKRAITSKIPQARLGEWQGGPVRLGFDVICFSRATGTERWRVISEGLHKRLKVYPDGREERFDGPNNFPRFQEEVEVLRLGPSKIKARVDAAVSVFERFATESISPTALAHYLNGLGFRTSWGGHFQGSHVRAVLEDPTYLGYYAYNRKHYGKFHRHTKGQAVFEPNYEEKQSKNDEADWVYSEQRLFPPMVERPTWDAVQKKLSKPRRVSAPRSPLLYLAGLVYCGNCGVKMVAGRGRSSKVKSRQGQPLRFEFICGSYQRAHRYHECGPDTCLRNGIYQHELEEYVERYLEETGKRLNLLTQRQGGDHLTDRLEDQATEAWQGFIDGVGRLEAYLAERHPEEYAAIIAEDEAKQAEEAYIRANPDHQVAPAGTLFAKLDLKAAAEKTPHRDPFARPGSPYVRDCLAAYRSLFDPAAVVEEVERLEAEHDALMGQWSDLPTPRAKQKAKERFAELEARIEQLRQQQQDIADVVEQHYRQLADLQAAIAAAKLAMRREVGERALRQRAEAIRAVIQRIECTFSVTGQTGGGHGRKNTRLAKVTIYPLVGDPGHFFIDSDNVLRATRATSPMYCPVW
jgi:hypothetical protein